MLTNSHALVFLPEGYSFRKVLTILVAAVYLQETIGDEPQRVLLLHCLKKLNIEC